MADILEKLLEVGGHDWRCSHLAHTSDTAIRGRAEVAAMRLPDSMRRLLGTEPFYDLAN